MTGGFLIVRRDGALWGLAADRVAGIEQVARGAKGLTVRFIGGRHLAVDAVLTLAGELRIRPLSMRLRHLLPRDSAGLAIFAGEPVLLMARESELQRV